MYPPYILVGVMHPFCLTGPVLYSIIYIYIYRIAGNFSEFETLTIFTSR